MGDADVAASLTLLTCKKGLYDGEGIEYQRTLASMVNARVRNASWNLARWSVGALKNLLQE